MNHSSFTNVPVMRHPKNRCDVTLFLFYAETTVFYGPRELALLSLGDVQSQHRELAPFCFPVMDENSVPPFYSYPLHSVSI